MKTVGLLLNPLDVLLFRDARPFGTGDSAYSTLPTPQTWAGAVKTLIHHQCKMTSEGWHGLHDKPETERDWKGQLKFRGPWLYVYDTKALQQSCQHNSVIKAGPLVPTPSDVVKLGKEEKANLARLQPLTWTSEQKIPGWNPPVETMLPLWIKAHQDLQAAGGFLDVDGLKNYLTGEKPAQVFPDHCFFERESRTGIGVNASTFTAKDSLIYSASFLRLRPGVCFYAEVGWPNGAPHEKEFFPDGKCLSWGGEGRQVALQNIVPYAWKELQPFEVSEDNRLSLLVTPGIFSRVDLPWHPREQGTLKAAAVPKPLPVSGWDMAGTVDNRSPRPKPTRFAVPAGAAYFWQNGRGRTTPFPCTPLLSLCDKPQDQDTGWGLALWGRWSPCT